MTAWEFVYVRPTRTGDGRPAPTYAMRIDARLLAEGAGAGAAWVPDDELEQHNPHSNCTCPGCRR